MITEDPIDQAGKEGVLSVCAPEYRAAAKRTKASLSFSLSLIYSSKTIPLPHTGVVDATPHYIGKAFCSKTLLLLALNCETDVTITRHHRTGYIL